MTGPMMTHDEPGVSNLLMIKCEGAYRNQSDQEDLRVRYWIDPRWRVLIVTEAMGHVRLEELWTWGRV